MISKYYMKDNIFDSKDLISSKKMNPSEIKQYCFILSLKFSQAVELYVFFNNNHLKGNLQS